MVVKKMMQEMIVGIEIELISTITKMGKTEKRIEILKITTNYGNSFKIDYEIGKDLKVGDFITVELKW